MLPTAIQPRRTQAERRTRSEEALLDAAAELIAQRGIDGASLASIGESAGVSRGLPTHHFGTKDVLVARLAERAQDRIQVAMRSEAERRHGRSVDQLTGLEIVELTAESYLDLFADPTPDQRALVVMWGATFASQTGVGGMIESTHRSYDGLADVIAGGQRDGSIRPDIDPMGSAVMLLGLIRGVAALLLNGAEVIDRSLVRETCSRLIRAGFETRHDGPTALHPSKRR